MRRRGAAAVMAMIFLVMFGALAVAFFAMASTSVHVSKNDRNTQQAMAAAESGMAFVQRQIADLVLRETDETGTDVLVKISAHLQDKLNGTLTLKDPVTQQDQSIPNIVYLTERGETGEPGDALQAIPWIAPHPNSTQRFQAWITLRNDDSTTTRPNLELIVIGQESRSGVRQTLKVELHPVDRLFRVFTMGMASKGRIDLADQKASIIGEPPEAGSILSTYMGDTAITLHGGTISGNVFVTGDPSTSFYTETSGGAIGGDTIDPNVAGSLDKALANVQQIPPPEFPDFLPNQFNLAGLYNLQSNNGSGHVTGNVGQNRFANIRITSNVTFSGNDVLSGIIFVQRGVTVTFQGSPTIRGTIVVEDPNLNSDDTPKDPPTNLTSTSTLNFQGVPVYDTPDYTHPLQDGTLVTQDVKDDLSGYSVLGPTAYIYMGGNTQGNSDGGETTTTTANPANAGFARTIVCGTLEQFGSGRVKISDGALITLSDTMVTGTRGYSGYYDGDGIRIVRSAGYQVPFGAYVHKYSYLMDVATYKEN